MTDLAAPTVRRIVVTADLLRPLPGPGGRPATLANARWLHALLSWPLARACALPVEIVNWGHGFDSEAFYRYLGTEPVLQSWARAHYLTQLPPQADALVAEAFRDSLVIGCEITPCIAASLGRAGVPVIDTIGTPLRFLDDVLNAWRTNVTDVHDRLQAYRFDEQEAWRQAGMLRAKMAWLPSLDLPDDSALLIGQVGSDKALIHKTEGRLLSYADHVEALFEIAQRHPSVFYKPHPYEDGHGASESVLSRFKSFRRTRDNVYRLLAQPGLATVYAISSGCVTEAGYFDKQGVHLYEALHPHRPASVDDHGLWNPVAVASAWLEPRFWRDVLSSLVEVVPGDEPATPFRAHRIRRTLNADWGFMDVDRVVMPVSS